MLFVVTVDAMVSLVQDFPLGTEFSETSFQVQVWSPGPAFGSVTTIEKEPGAERTAGSPTGCRSAGSTPA